MKRNMWILAGCAGYAIMATTAASWATMVVVGPVVTLTDEYSTVQFDLGSDQGMNVWTTDGTDHLVRQWFWYRIGPNGAESPLNALGVPFYGTSDTDWDGAPDTLYVRYTGTEMQATATFLLTGTGAGRSQSHVAETITLTNLTSQPLDLHFFQYCNLTLGGDATDWSAEINGGNTAEQADLGMYFSEAVLTPRPSHYQVDYVPILYNLLTDGLPTTLNDNGGPIGPGDLSWSFQWDATLGPAGTGTASLIVSKDKRIVPEPATLGILVAGGLSAVLRRRRA